MSTPPRNPPGASDSRPPGYSHYLDSQGLLNHAQNDDSPTRESSTAPLRAPPSSPSHDGSLSSGAPSTAMSTRSIQQIPPYHNRASPAGRSRNPHRASFMLASDLHDLVLRGELYATSDPIIQRFLQRYGVMPSYIVPNSATAEPLGIPRTMYYPLSPSSTTIPTPAQTPGDIARRTDAVIHRPWHQFLNYPQFSNYPRGPGSPSNEDREEPESFF